MADAMLKSAVNSHRNWNVLGRIFTDSLNGNGNSKAHVVHRQLSNSATRHGSLSPGSFHPPSPPGPSNLSTATPGRLLAQVVQQGLRTEQLNVQHICDYVHDYLHHYVCVSSRILWHLWQNPMLTHRVAPLTRKRCSLGWRHVRLQRERWHRLSIRGWRS